MRRNTIWTVIGAIVVIGLLVGVGVVVGRAFNNNGNNPPGIDEEPKTTGEILQEIRQLMRMAEQGEVHAYIVQSNDAHQSEYPAARDRRLSYVTEFTGSVGTAVIGLEEAAIWVDGRYHLQAEQQIDQDHWIIMKDGLPETPKLHEWLIATLPSGSTVATDAFLISSSEFDRLNGLLTAAGLKLIGLTENLIDSVWNTRPPLELNEIKPWAFQYSGRRVADKLRDVDQALDTLASEAVILTALDDLAWITNLRGGDLGYTPIFYAYALYSKAEGLYLFVGESRISSDVINHFVSEEVGNVVKVREYEAVLGGIEEYVNRTSGRIVVPNTSSRAIAGLVPAHRAQRAHSPVQLLKARKNEVEAEGMRNAHVRDGAALVRYLHWLEENIGKETITEISGADKLLSFRSEQELFQGPSFSTISGSGPNGAVIHYKPEEETDRELNVNEMYLVDSGGQYLDGTTDVTRTVHFGTPTEFQKEAFTRVLKGFIAIHMANFPPGAPDTFFDALGRRHLWDIGLDYGHGTGHGIGAYLGVHEYPPLLSFRAVEGYPGIVENMFTSDEPGYYENGEFGIRIEDIVQSTKAEGLRFDFAGRGALTFRPVTLAPIQKKLIDLSLLEREELRWLNNYHDLIRDQVGGLLFRQGHVEDYQWLINETAPIPLLEE